jgi:hypothetical protein
VPFPCFFINGICHSHILDICLCSHIHFFIEYNHLDMCDMICTKNQTFSSFSLPLCNYREDDYHSKVPYL